jgi:hypothetical protein
VGVQATRRRSRVEDTADGDGIAGHAGVGLLRKLAGRPDLAQLTLNTAVGPLLLACVSATTAGAVLASRRPRHPVGWLPWVQERTTRSGRPEW